MGICTRRPTAIGLPHRIRNLVVPRDDWGPSDFLLGADRQQLALLPLLPLLRRIWTENLKDNHYEGHAPDSIEKLKRLWNTGFTK